MPQHTTFRFCLDPTVEQTMALARHVGAARFAYNQCLRLHLDAREHHRALSSRGGDADAVDQARAGVPWSKFSLINAFNQRKVSEDAGRRFLTTGDGVAEVEVTGLAWRDEEFDGRVVPDAEQDHPWALVDPCWVRGPSTVGDTAQDRQYPSP